MGGTKTLEHDIGQVTRKLISFAESEVQQPAALLQGLDPANGLFSRAADLVETFADPDTALRSAA